MPATAPPRPTLLLASASPRRHELLLQIGVAHTVVPAHIDETRHVGESPRAYVERLAREKAQSVAAKHPSCPVLAADTTVVLDGEVLNKPRDRADAEATLRRLSAATHTVLTGIAVLFNGQLVTHVEETAVHFLPIDERDLQLYLRSGDPLDKAGSYGIQGFAARWVAGIHGDYSNVVGLPLAATVLRLRQVAPELLLPDQA